MLNQSTLTIALSRLISSLVEHNPYTPTFEGLHSEWFNELWEYAIQRVEYNDTDRALLPLVANMVKDQPVKVEKPENYTTINPFPYKWWGLPVSQHSVDHFLEVHLGHSLLKGEGTGLRTSTAWLGYVHLIKACASVRPTGAKWADAQSMMHHDLVYDSNDDDDADKWFERYSAIMRTCALEDPFVETDLYGVRVFLYQYRDEKIVKLANLIKRRKAACEAIE